MISTVGQLLLENNEPLLKMWSVSVKPGARPFVRHSHFRFEITAVTGGSGEYTTDNAVYPMEPGDVFVAASNEVHCITNAGENGLFITNLHFEPRYLAPQGSIEDNSALTRLCFFHSPEFKNRIPADKAEIIRQNHNCIKEEFEKNDGLLPTAVEAHLNLILIDLIRNQNYDANPTCDAKEHTVNMLRVYDYIEQHICEDLKLERLAEIMALTPNYFSHLFKKLNGITVCDYINAKRIEKATKILTSGNNKLTMLEIATTCGFNNTAHFNKMFKKYRGFTPSQLKADPKLLWH